MAQSPNEMAIRTLLESRAAAVRRGDVDAMMKDVANDVVIFDVVDPLQREGKAASLLRASEWVASYAGPITWENRDVAVLAGDDVAFSHALSHVKGTLKSGTRVDMWFRTTLGFRRIGERWWIVHDHGSVPFDAATGKASLSLKP